MTPLLRWTLLASVAIASCSDNSPNALVSELPSPDGPRLVFVVAPGLSPIVLERAKGGGLTPNLAKLSYQSVMRPSVPGHPVAVMSSLTTGLEPGEHGSFDGTARVANQYRRVPAPTVTPSRVANGRVGAPRFESHSEAKPFWTGLAEAGVPVSVLFAPRELPESDTRARVLAGDLPNVVGRRAGAMLFIRPGEVPEAPARPLDEVTQRRGRRDGRRRARSEDAPSDIEEAPSAVEGEEEPVEGAPDAQIEALSVPDGVRLMRELSAGVWLAELPLDVTGLQGGTKTLVAQVVVREQGDSAVVQAGQSEIELFAGERSPWVSVRFSAGALEVPAMARFHLLSRDPLRIAVEDPTVDPQKPFYPISTPRSLVTSVAGRAGPGPFTDPGLFDSAAAKLADPDFRLRRLADDCQWRTDVLIGELETTESRVLLLFQDVIERAIALGGETDDETLSPALGAAFSALDRSVWRIRSRLRPSDTLVLVSPFSTSAASRVVHLNAWLRQKRYLRVKRDGDIDWQKSQAYAAGQGGIYLNLKGREPSGGVPANRAGRLAKKIARELRGMRDAGTKVVKEVWLGDELAGSKRGLAPDVMVAMEPGYFVETTMSVRPGESLFSDGSGLRAPLSAADGVGVVLASRPLAVDEASPMDVAATAYAFVGVALSDPVGRVWFAPPAP